MAALINVKKISGIFLLAGFLFSCKVTWVPEYNAQLEEQVAKTAKANDRLYLDMLDVPKANRNYDNFKERYNEIASEINSIMLKNEARPKNTNFIAIIKNLKSAFEESQKFHKDNNTLENGEIKAYQATLAGFWRPLYLAERALK
jgi:hypothetical protein